MSPQSWSLESRTSPITCPQGKPRALPTMDPPKEERLCAWPHKAARAYSGVGGPVGSAAAAGFGSARLLPGAAVRQDGPGRRQRSGCVTQEGWYTRQGWCGASGLASKETVTTCGLERDH